MLLVDPGLVRAGDKGFDRFTTNAGDGVAGDERKQWMPLEGLSVEMCNWVWNSVEQRIALEFGRRHTLLMVPGGADFSL